MKLVRQSGLRKSASVVGWAPYCAVGMKLVIEEGHEMLVGEGLQPTNLGKHVAGCVKCDGLRQAYQVKRPYRRAE